MIRPVTLAALLASGLIAAVAQATDESDVIGTWYVDVEAYRSDLERAFDAYVAEMPEPMRAQMKAMMLGQLDEAFEPEQAYVEFRPGGEVVFYGDDEPPMAGTWSLSGDEVQFGRIEREEDEPGYAGTVAGGVMRVEPDRELPMLVPLTLRRQ